MVKVTKKSQVAHSQAISRGKNWTYLNNFALADGYVAQCNNISTKTGATNKPNPVTLSNYDFSIPENAVITSISLRWRDRCLSYESDVDETLFPVFDKTTFSFNNCNLKDMQGDAPTIHFTTKSLTIKHPVITPREINSKDFGVTIQYSYNNSENIGGIYCDYVKIDVKYEIPSYNVSITEPRHSGSSVTWSTPEDPTILDIGELCTTKVYFRSLNGYDGGQQTVRINFPINYQLLDITPSTGELIIYEGETYVDWVVSPPLNAVGGICRTVSCDISFTPRAFVGTEMVSATIQSTGQVAKYYVYVSSDVNYSDDVFVVCPQFRQLEELQQFTIALCVENISRESLEDNGDVYPLILKLWSIEHEEYVPFELNPYNDLTSSNGNITPNLSHNSNRDTYYIDLKFNNYDTYQNLIRTGLSPVLHNFQGDFGEYEFHVFLPHDLELSNYDKYTQNIYILEAESFVFDCKSETWYVNTCNIATNDGEGYAFNCRTANGFNYSTRMGGCKSLLEQRVRHIGGLKIPKSHYNPKLKFSNKVNEGVYKNRAYYNKTGQWEHDLSLNIYLPKFEWRTLKEFVKMDKPVAIDTCPSCSDDDVLNHRGWVEIEDISNVERVNSWWYKGEIGVRRITDKYYGKANIVKGNRVNMARIPYTFMNTVRNGDYYLNYFELLGGGQLIYDTDNDIINQILVPTGEEIHIRNKWASKDIDDYKFHWRSVLPSEVTDESNDYKYNSIVYSVINNLNGETVLTYTLYDFTTFNEVGEVVNTCKVSCTLFDNQQNPTLLFTKQIRLDYVENNPTDYYSTTRFEFNASILTISESGLNGQELVERDINLPNGEYLIDIAFCNNDVGLLEPDFISYLNMDLKENILANPYSNFYSDLLVSSFVLPNLNLLFYRYSQDGMLYYYYGDTTASYLVDGFQQYKGGVDLQTSTGASILYVDNYTSMLYLSNGLCRIGFDRVFGTVSFYVYDASSDSFLYVNMVKIDDWSEFDIVSITDDKAIIQFGETIWTMWRGHPFIQCEHINTDLVINDDYNTINCEAIVTGDGDVVYDGTYGKRENYLYNIITYPVVTVEGEHSPNFISGDSVTLKCYVRDKYGIKLNTKDYPDVNLVGKVNFIINDNTSYYDVAPSVDANEEYYWTCTFTPPFTSDDYAVYARFIPVGQFTESTSSIVNFTVRKIDTKLSLTGESKIALSNGVYSLRINLLAGSKGLSNAPIKIYDKSKGLLETIYTGSNGIANFNYNLADEGILELYAVYDGDNTYNPVTSVVKDIIVVDDTKSDVTLTSAITTGKNGSVTLRFNGVSSGDVKVTVDDSEYVFAMNSSKTIHVSATGTYNYVAEYLGDGTHNKSILKSSFTVSKTAQTIELDSNASIVNLGSTIDFIINGSISNMQYILYDNDSPVANGTLSNGTKTIQYLPNYSGIHKFKAVYKGDTWNNTATSTTLSINVQNSTTKLTHKNGAIYRNNKDYILLTDANNKPISNKQIKYTVNGITYNRTTNKDGIAGMDIRLQQGTYPVHVTFLGDNTYLQSSIDYNLTVKGNETVWKAPQSLQNSHNSNTAPYQIWNDLTFDGVNGSNYASCGNSMNINNVIGTKVGTWNTPDQLKLFNYGFNIPANAQIRELKVRVYERQYDPRSNGYPNIGNAVISIQNHDPRTCETPPVQSQTGFNVNEVSWSSPNIVVGALNDSSFTVFLNHGKNNSGNTGALMLKYFEVGVSYSLPTTIME